MIIHSLNHAINNEPKQKQNNIELINIKSSNSK